MTNYDRIRCMSIEEMAEFMYSEIDKICFNTCERETGNEFQCPYEINVTNCETTCVNCIKKYLESEAE